MFTCKTKGKMLTALNFVVWPVVFQYVHKLGQAWHTWWDTQTSLKDTWKYVNSPRAKTCTNSWWQKETRRRVSKGKVVWHNGCNGYMVHRYMILSSFCFYHRIRYNVLEIYDIVFFMLRYCVHTTTQLYTLSHYQKSTKWRRMFVCFSLHVL